LRATKELRLLADEKLNGGEGILQKEKWIQAANGYFVNIGLIFFIAGSTPKVRHQLIFFFNGSNFMIYEFFYGWL
jgi:hypothetical protein